MILFYLFYILFAFFIIRWAIKKIFQVDSTFDIKEKMEKVKENNILVNDIKDFEEEYDTSDKSKTINNFIKGEN